MPTTIQATDLKPLENIRALFVGRKGCGKSIAATSLVDCDPNKKAIAIDLDERKQSLRGRDRIDIVTFGREEGYTEIVDYLHNLSIEVDKGNYQEKYSTLLFSSTTSLQYRLLKESTKLITNVSTATETKGAQKIGGMIIPGMRNRLYVANGVDEIILNQLFYLPGNLIIEGHVVNHYDSKNEVDGKTLLGTDKIAEKIPTQFDEVWEFAKSAPPNPQLPPDYEVYFRSNMANTTYPQLPTKINITGKRFYIELKKILE